ncbi:MAG: M28 family peptidase, partial [Bacteroidota bacterium]
DLEDYGEDSGNNAVSWCLGSQYWSRNPHSPNYTAKYGILLDMVGSKNARFTKEQVSMRYAPTVMNKVWKLANAMGYGGFFVEDKGRALTDDHLFVNQIAKIPMIDIINFPVGSETGFMKHWHTTHDDMKHIDKRTLKAVGQVVLATIYREASGRF